MSSHCKIQSSLGQFFAELLLHAPNGPALTILLRPIKEGRRCLPVLTGAFALSVVSCVLIFEVKAARTARHRGLGQEEIVLSVKLIYPLLLLLNLLIATWFRPELRYFRFQEGKAPPRKSLRRKTRDHAAIKEFASVSRLQAADDLKRLAVNVSALLPFIVRWSTPTKPNVILSAKLLGLFENPE